MEKINIDTITKRCQNSSLQCFIYVIIIIIIIIIIISWRYNPSRGRTYQSTAGLTPTVKDHSKNLVVMGGSARFLPVVALLERDYLFESVAI